jgi:5'-deoxynucleotidase YfbR-like HD superfamily hydrolase
MYQMNLSDILRTQYVLRWSMVDTERKQNLAEHHYNVAMIAMRYCEVLDSPSHIKDRVLKYALVHDLSEVFTGDIPTPTKKHMNTALFDKLDARLFVHGKAILTEDELDVVTFIVKIADLIDAAQYLVKYGMRSNAQKVLDGLRDKIQHLGGAKAISVYKEAVMESTTSLDQVMGTEV